MSAMIDGYMDTLDEMGASRAMLDVVADLVYHVKIQERRELCALMAERFEETLAEVKRWK